MFTLLKSLFASDASPVRPANTRTILGGDAFGLERREMPAVLSGGTVTVAAATPVAPRTADQLAAPAVQRALTASAVAGATIQAAHGTMNHLTAQVHYLRALGTHPHMHWALAQSAVMEQKLTVLRSAVTVLQGEYAAHLSARLQSNSTVAVYRAEREAAAKLGQPLDPIIQKQNQAIRLEVVRLDARTQVLQANAAVVRALLAS